MGAVDRLQYTRCRACDGIAPLNGMQPVRPGATADLGAVLSGEMMCADETDCRARFERRHPATVLAVVVPVESGREWGGGHVALITPDPRHAVQHASAYRAIVVRWPVHSDYRVR